MVSQTRSKRRTKNSLVRGVGSIVWVRRRNGSWWPGKIMALDELSGVHIVSPRTGTPVKLLGREDASVDWYNLEKSKRVKAFRCGEFDESIERAESYLGMRAKKRDKYARREDAILHALELEKKLLEKEHGQLIASNFKNMAYSGYVKKKLPVPKGSSRYDRPQPVIQVLQGIANLPASHLLQSDSCTRSLSEPVVDQTGNIHWAKRSTGVYIPSESSDCLGDQESISNQTGTCVAEQSESREIDKIDTDSDQVTQLPSGSSDTDSEHLEHFEVQGKHENVENEEQLDGVTVSGSLHYLRSNNPAPANSGMSKWQMRRKRNVRYLTKKPCIESDVKLSSGLNDGTYIEENCYGYSNGLNEIGIIENDFRAQRKGFDLKRYALTSKADASNLRNRIGPDFLDCEDFDLGDGMRTMLIDVELKVQASYKKSVPIVSLMSKLDGKAIIGHPIQIEALKEGSSDIFFATQPDFHNEARDNERETTLPPVWRTARRTAYSRVPRHPQRNSLSKKPNAWGSRKLPKKVSLSSIGFKQKFKHLKNDGLIKIGSVPTALAWIPLKLVFSRLYEAVGRPQH